MNTKPKNRRHIPEVSAVKEYCICGVKVADREVHHIPTRREFATPPNVPCSRCGSARGHVVHSRAVGNFCHDYVPVMPDFNARVHQIGVTPDTPECRAVVSRTLGWLWTAQIDDGVWTVRTPQDWPAGVSMDSSIHDPDLGEISVELVWP